MSADISEQPGTSSWRVMRRGGGAREQRQEENRVEEGRVGRADGGADHRREQGSGSQGATRTHPAVQRELVIQRQLEIQINIVRLCVVILTLLFAIFTLRTVDIVIHYKSANNNVTMEQEELQSRYDNLKTLNDTLTQKIKQLEERQGGDAGKLCPDGWESFGCSCYYISTGNKTWEDSREECVKLGAHLWIINSAAEERFIRPLGTGTPWIGLTKKVGQTWTWENGKPLEKAEEISWGAKKTSGDYVEWDCVEYQHDDGKWADKLCAPKTDNTKNIKFNNWICEKCCSSCSS